MVMINCSPLIQGYQVLRNYVHGSSRQNSNLTSRRISRSWCVCRALKLPLNPVEFNVKQFRKNSNRNVAAIAITFQPTFVASLPTWRRHRDVATRHAPKRGTEAKPRSLAEWKPPKPKTFLLKKEATLFPLEIHPRRKKILFSPPICCSNDRL